MIARVGRFQVQPGKLDEFKVLIETEVFTRVHQHKGYRNGYLLMDRETGSCITIGFWRTAEEAAADARSVDPKDQARYFAEFLTAPPLIELYDVAARD